MAVRLAEVGERTGPDVETAGPDYHRRFAGPTGRWFLEVQESVFLDLAEGLPRGARILDVGGLHGQLAPLLVEAGHRVTVVGSAAAASEGLRRVLDDDRCELHVADLLRLPYERDAFDAAVSFRLLPHVDDPARLIGELCRVSRGPVVVDYPSAYSVNVISRPFFFLKKRVEGNSRPFNVFRPGMIKDWFESSGYRPSSSRGQYFFPMAFHRMLGWVRGSRFLERLARITGLTRLFGSPVIVRADPDGYRSERTRRSAAWSRTAPGREHRRPKMGG